MLLLLYPQGKSLQYSLGRRLDWQVDILCHCFAVENHEIPQGFATILIGYFNMEP
jgi:hypothetical protein